MFTIGLFGQQIIDRDKQARILATKGKVVQAAKEKYIEHQDYGECSCDLCVAVRELEEVQRGK